jgi:hypothetical protein
VCQQAAKAFDDCGKGDDMKTQLKALGTAIVDAEEEQVC